MPVCGFGGRTLNLGAVETKHETIELLFYADESNHRLFASFLALAKKRLALVGGVERKEVSHSRINDFKQVQPISRAGFL